MEAPFLPPVSAGLFRFSCVTRLARYPAPRLNGYVPITPPSVRRMAIVAERGRAPEGPSGQELTAFGFFGSLRGGCSREAIRPDAAR